MDDFFVGAAAAGTVGRGTTRQPMIRAVSRGGRGGPGTCALRVVPDAAGGAYSRFAEEHVGVLSHVRADMWQGVTAGLRGWPGLDQRPFDASDPASSLALVHHVISDFKAYALGTFHGLSRARLQGVCDEFSWRYCHRGPAPASALAADVAAAPHVPRAELEASFGPQPRVASPRARTGARVRQRERVEELLREAGPGDGLLGLLDDGFRERRE